MQDYSEHMSLEAPAWLMDESQASDVVLGVELVIYRNAAEVPFCNALTPELADKVISKIEQAVSLSFPIRMNLSEIDLVHRFRCAEKWTIPAAVAEKPCRSVLLMNERESESAIICGQEHLTLRAAGTFEKFSQPVSNIQQIVHSLDSEFNWAQHPEFGYLSPNPANCGTGTVYSAICHIPASIIANKVPQIKELTDSYGIIISDPWAGGFNGANSYAKFSNRTLIGKSTEELLVDFSQFLEGLMYIEREARAQINERGQVLLADKVMRTYGIVSYAKLIELGEFDSLISTLRLGAVLGLLPIAIRSLDELLIIGQHAHISSLIEQSFTPTQVAMLRAKLLKEKLALGTS